MSMKQFLEFSLEKGGSILVEIEKPQPEGGLVPAGRTSELVTKATQNFESALEKIKPAAETIMAKLRELPDIPDQIQVEFGVNFSADAGAIIAATGIKANFKVTLSWIQSHNKQ
jgi:hypothetical protein